MDNNDEDADDGVAEASGFDNLEETFGVDIPDNLSDRLGVGV